MSEAKIPTCEVIMGFSRDHGLLTEICAAGLGFEPRFYGSEPHVLPLDDPAK